MQENWHENLLTWFRAKKRPLPWRLEKSTYRVWISEVMSQQTTLAFLIPKFNTFVAELPNVQALANASEETMRRLWSGLGYYARARNLQKGARVICDQWNGDFPHSYEAWRTIPGCGPYTSSVIASVCFNEKVACVDGNVTRAVSRLLALSEDVWSLKGQKQISDFVSKQILKVETPGDFNEAMMELGATVCTKQKPSCESCPLTTQCEAFRRNCVSQFPPVKPRKAFVEEALCTLVFKDAESYFLGRRKKGFLEGTVGFPVLRQQDFKKWANNYDLHKLPSYKVTTVENRFRHTITNHKITAEVILIEGDYHSNIKLIESLLTEPHPIEKDLENALSTSFDKKAWATLCTRVSNQSLFSLEP